ncbi:MAG: ribosomal subunit protein large subunit ribosomal protein [Candidatus Parcubacteria bacterium]|jgi:large subunit ribosomal protein L23
MSKISTQKHSNAVIKNPRITEKATVSAEKNQFVFEVSPEATKASVAAAVKQLYKVTPVKVNIVRLPAKKVFVRGRAGTKSAIKKAYVFLKKGDKIELA